VENKVYMGLYLQPLPVLMGYPNFYSSQINIQSTSVGVALIDACICK